MKEDFYDSLGKTMAEAILKGVLWNKIKNDWWEPGYDGQLFKDEEKNTLAVNIEGSIALLGYFHFYHDINKQPNFQNSILNDIADFVSRLKEKTTENDWESVKVIIVTPYKLSNYERMDFSILPKDVSYFYMAESAEADKKTYEMRLDQEIIDFHAGDDMLNYFFEQGKNASSKPEFWNCQICGGNNNTDCLYFDPTECPKFT
jgi:hypothetical protein